MHKDKSSTQLDQDPEKNAKSPPQPEHYGVSMQQRTISFGPNERRGRRGSEHRRSISRSRSRSRAQSISSIPIEFRRISFQIADSETREKYEVDLKDSKSKRGETPDDSRYFDSLQFHHQSVDVLYRHFNSTIDGLSSAEAASRLARNGKNELPHVPTNYLKRLLKYVFGGFCSILWIGVIIFFICWRPLGDPDPAPYNLGLAILVLIVIFLQASFSAFQDWSTARTMKSILDLVPTDAMVVRSGETTTISAADVVVGDIVKISVGNKVPADLRLLTTSGDTRFDRSMLTGESEDVDGATEMTESNFLETRNVALMGTMVTNGSATGIVVLTGEHTVMGHITVSSTSVKEQPTLIQREITRFVRIIVVLTVFLALLILLTWVGWLRVKHFQYMNVIAMLDDVMGCVVAFIPEGMPVGVALTLMLVATRMKNNNILPKGLSTVETLGCVNVICSDKTGTLTQNKMSVVTATFVDQVMSAEKAISAVKEGSLRPIMDLHKAAALCNDATFDAATINYPVSERKVLGNPTDGAVLRFVEEAHQGAIKELNERYQRVFAIPFNSKNKWMLTLHKSEISEPGKNSYLLLMKGASDILLPHCNFYWSCVTNTVRTLDDSAKQQLAAAQEQMSRKSQRVILLCQRPYSPTQALGTNAFGDEIHASGIADLTLIGMFGIVDPPRPEAAATVASCRRAGARFFMVTGDLGLTGAAIAREIGIFSGTAEPDTFETIVQRRSDCNSSSSQSSKEPDSRWPETSLLLEGPSISQLTDKDWDLVCQYDEIVFGRTMPDQKLRIVNEFRARDNVVAVTGDGVNDAPAMRAADVGVAVITGSDVALEAADLILMDKFDSIIEAIRLGRLVFQNLQKVISYLLPAGSWSEIWPVILNVFFGVPLPLSSFLMIIICVFTDLLCSLSLIMEQQEFDLLDLPPRNHKKDHLINLKVYIQSYLFIGVLETICAHAMFFYYYWKHAGIPAGALFFAFEKYADGFYGYTDAELTQFNVVGQSVYFIALLIMQWGNILSVRNKRLSILQADPIRKQRRNPWLIASMVVSLSIAIFVTEEPGLQQIFGTGSAPLEFWFLPIPLALGILLMDELRKLSVRVWPKGITARIAW
ncbi:hypothetical protein N7509_013246 [Penicillium cosmopolitanum]|uniref:Cation-transporting P-type ATPase N-terminal domain-containing protein n=1 Tax=Penicillium cosmopolitanum TaxID=1131564 RepID=A0A9W9VEB5_9EURO|nr:uncharacterized protein N7509_013246 [Penicillium cosmopolitanum]KAJ5376360.1 hypothetical protein N7509_013246 [Penicillium cosmopolitanum]